MRKWFAEGGFFYAAYMENEDNKMAEREGFEPPVPITRNNCLAGSPVQPLQHLSTR